MNHQTLLRDDNEIQKTKQAYILKRAESYGAVVAFSLRSGEGSSRPYESLNFSNSYKDEQKNVTSNLQILSDRLRIKGSRIITCDQEHGDTIAIFNHAPETTTKADAIIAVNSELYPAIKTADCVPILIIDPITKISAAIHAGWRGTVLRITRKVVIALNKDFGIKYENLIVALGPAIGLCCYEVDRTVLNPLFSTIPWAVQFSVPSNNSPKQLLDKRRLDLSAINRHELIDLGILPENIHSIKMCTQCSENKLYSYRRDGKFSGRSIAITGFRPTSD